eukprot:scaffold567_cov230-Alexandrium_tamarense.AAC.27
MQSASSSTASRSRRRQRPTNQLALAISMLSLLQSHAQAFTSPPSASTWQHRVSSPLQGRGGQRPSSVYDDDIPSFRYIGVSRVLDDR